jgi:hypothetical protein
MTIKTQLKAGKLAANHNETLRRAKNIVWMRRQPLTASRKQDRLELLVVRAGLRAGLRRSYGRPRR